MLIRFCNLLLFLHILALPFLLICLLFYNLLFLLFCKPSFCIRAFPFLLIYLPQPLSFDGLRLPALRLPAFPVLRLPAVTSITPNPVALGLRRAPWWRRTRGQLG